MIFNRFGNFSDDLIERGLELEESVKFLHK